MKKVIRLTESDLMKIVKRVISENEKPHHKYAKMNHGEFMGEIKSLYKEVADEFNLCGAKIRRFKKNKCKK